MGKSFSSSSAARFQNFARVIASGGPKQAKPISPKNINIHNKSNPNNNNSSPQVSRAQLASLKMERPPTRTRVPLKEVVSDCVKRWFHDTLREAKAGDPSMQLLVGQMYNSGYGIRKDTEKGRAWINRASKGRSSAWKVSDKQPGYNASDSDSEAPIDARS